MQFLAAILLALEGANWQRGGGQGEQPKPYKFPEDRTIKVKDADELQEKKARNRAHLQRRRAQLRKEVKDADSS